LSWALPLHIAASTGRLRAVRALAMNGSLLEARDRLGRTPLDRALELDGEVRRDVAAALLDAGADVVDLTAFPCGDGTLDDELLRRGAIEHDTALGTRAFARS
jgi:ankyrin repeat protein